MLSGGLLGIFTRDTVPALTPSQCLNRRNRFEPCQLCASACPFGALTCAGGPPVIEEKKCQGCGLCAAACPSEALHLRDYHLFRRLAGADGPLELRCLKSGGAYCLRGVRPAFWASLMLYRAEQTFIFVLPCPSCELAGRAGGAEKVPGPLGMALEFLRTLEVRPKIEIEQDAAYERELSRRELMASFFAWGREKGKNLLEDVLWRGGNDAFLARRFLAGRLDVRERESGAQALLLRDGVFHDFAVSGQCDGCGLCEGLCPAGAWTLRRLGEEGRGAEAPFKGLSYNMEDCMGCGLCARKCPQGALSSLAEFSWSKRPILKRKFEMNRCRHCGAWFLRHDPKRELCERCSRRP